MDKLYWKDIKRFINDWLYFSYHKKEESILQTINNATKKDITAACEYTINNVGYILNFLHNDSSSLQGKTLLEIGAGQDFGISLILADLGFDNVIIVDPFLVEWQDDYHPLYYSTLLELSKKKYPEIAFKSLSEVIRNNSHQTEKLTCYRSELENLSQISNEVVDVSFSNAVFEHLVNPVASIKELARITKKDGVGFHQIDLRDHRDFNKPLEFLTFPEKMFKKLIKINNAHFGNRIRYNEYNVVFEKVGFLVSFKPDSFADEVYLNTLLKKAISKYRQMPKDYVGTLGGRFFIQKIT